MARNDWHQLGEKRCMAAISASSSASAYGGSYQ